MTIRNKSKDNPYTLGFDKEKTFIYSNESRYIVYALSLFFYSNYNVL